MNNNVKNFVALDTETTGLFKEDKIIEISLAKYQNDKLVAKYDQYINPEGRRNDAESINHITPDMLENQPVLTDIETNIHDFISDLPIIGHNISFDLRFMKNNGIDISTYKDKKIDTLVLARRRRKTNNKLDQLAAEFNIVNSQQHNGLQDAIATAEVYKKIRDLYPETLSTEYISNEAENNLLGGAMYVITGKVDYMSARTEALMAYDDLDKLKYCMQEALNSPIPKIPRKSP